MEKYRVEPGAELRLKDRDASDAEFSEGKSESKREIAGTLEKLEPLQDLLYASHQRKLLIVLQGMDASGKDGTIRNVFEGMDPLGIRIASFEAPTKEELDHDFLWRIHKQVPGRGEVTIFNRSHYEDVLVVRVRNLAPEDVWRPRYQQIVDFEKLLTDTGTTILKFHLQIDKEEQRERLQKRIEDPAKRWKFRRGDLEDRLLWDDYQAAYEDALSRTSTEAAPWYVIPSNRKWYRNVVISNIILKTLQSFEMSYPEGEEGVEGIVVE